MRLAFFALVFMGVVASRAAVVGKPVEYSADGVTLRGYIAYDDKFNDKRPGVIVVHEWWGHNEYARKRARMLAETPTRLSPEERAELEVAIAKARRREFAGEAEVAAMYAKHAL